MTHLPDAWRQTHATTDTKRAKAQPLKKCLTCPAKIAGKGKWCLPCADVRYNALLAARRAKYKGRVYGKKGAA